MIYTILIAVVIALIILIIILWKIFELLETNLSKLERTLTNNNDREMLGLLDSIKIQIERANSHWYLFPYETKKIIDNLIDAVKNTTSTNRSSNEKIINQLEYLNELIWKLNEKIDMSNNIGRSHSGQYHFSLEQITENLEQINKEIKKK
jgi:hypothetical protein